MTTTNIHRIALATCAALLIGIATPAAGQRTPPAYQPLAQPGIEEAPRVQATQPRLEQPTPRERALREPTLRDLTPREPTPREPTPQPDLNVRPVAPSRPAAAGRQNLLPQPDEPQGETQQQLAATQQDREWLIAYLVSHEGYSFHQIDQLEARLDKMSPTLIGTLVTLYKQKHERALQREAAVQAMRRNMVAADEMQLRRNQTALNRANSDENAAAQHEQSVFDTQRQDTTQGYFENAPYRSAPYYGGGYRYSYPYQYFPAYGY
jgi:hypothetical protein